MAEPGALSDDDLIAALRKEVAAWFSNVHLLEFEELLHRFNRMKGIRADADRMDGLLEHVEGINDERDSVPILLAVRGLWPLIRDKILKPKEKPSDSG